MAVCLDHSTFVQRVVISKPPPDLSHKVWGENVPALCNYRQNAKGVTRCGHNERKDKGRIIRLDERDSGRVVRFVRNKALQI